MVFALTIIIATTAIADEDSFDDLVDCQIIAWLE